LPPTPSHDSRPTTHDQGRLLGKRVSGEFFVGHCLEHDTHFCVYLVARIEQQIYAAAVTSWERARYFARG